MRKSLPWTQEHARGRRGSRCEVQTNKETTLKANLTTRRRPAARTPTASRLFCLESLESRLLLTTYYVSTAGADANAGTSDAAAFRTLQKAANTVAAGDVVLT